MKTKIIFLSLFAAVSALCQTPTAPPTFIRGTMGIQFGDTKDNYSLDLNVCNSSLFRGTVTVSHYQPPQGLVFKNPEVPMGINYQLDCDVMNPKNPSQTKNVGQILGKVSVNGAGLYDYQNGTLECSVIPMGQSAGTDSFFRGGAYGKPLSRPSGWDWHSLQQAEVSISRMINGKVSTITLKKYDQMKFDNCVLCGGPVMFYQPVTVNGLFLYDYEKNTWFLKDITVQYQVGQDMKIDRLSGDIRWMPDPKRSQNGLGEYDFDVKANEPAPNEDQVYSASSAPSDESAFFSTDNSTPGVSGSWKYKDALDGQGNTTASQVQIDMEGNLLTKQQMMVLFKLLVLSSIVPMNSD